MSLALIGNILLDVVAFIKTVGSGQQQKAGPLNLYSQYRAEVSFTPELD